ncbi:MAG: M81 family metallopeptidase [Trueperaceae bacterium]
MRVGIIGLIHESNTFFIEETPYENFRRHHGEVIRDGYARAFHELGGFFEGLAHEGMGPVPLYVATHTPSGTIDSEALEKFWRDIETALESVGELDGLLVAAHGAAVCVSQPDMDGWWLAKLREKVGRLPMVCTLDLHANVSEKMIAAVDATIAYRTNPHVDQRERGLEAAHLLARILRGEIKATQALATPPVVINIERQLTSASPLLELEQLAETIRQRPKVLSVSVALGFPYADVPELGSSFIVVTENDSALAQRYAEELADYLWQNREDFLGTFVTVAAALAGVLEAVKPVCLLDMGDNIGGGSPGDGTLLAHALLEKKIRAFVCLYDPDVVKRLEHVAVGSSVRLALGGKTDKLHGAPLELQAKVLSFHSGNFYESEVRHGGDASFDMGTTVLVQAASLTIMLTSKRMPPFSLQQLLSCGVEPKDFEVLVAKGVHAPVAAYAPVCPTFIRVNTPGITSADLGHFQYTQRRKPLFPFEK